MGIKAFIRGAAAFAIIGGMAFAGIPASQAMEITGATTLNVSTSVIPNTAISIADTGTTIVNDTFWKDTEGNPIYSQGGGIFDFTDPATGTTKHYWYGVHFEEAEEYAANPTAAINHNTFKSVDVYSSEDLVNWTNEGQALSREQADAFSADFGGRSAGWVCRMGVAYVKSLGKYAMFIQHEMPTDDTGKNFDKKVLLATSDTPAGPFKADRRLNMKDYGLGTTNTGDQTVFQDTDGTCYLVYSYGSGRGSMWVAEIGERDGRVDLINPTKIYQGKGREGNALFKYQGKYYAAASDLFGWDSSRIHYLVSDNVFGPYTPTNQTVIMDGSREDFGHITQTGFYYTVHGSEQETVIHAGDRWADFAGNGIGYNQWNPLSFDEQGTPSFNSMSRWSLDASTGRWNVDEANDYVLNGTFEADRVTLGANGYSDKDGNPIEDLAGWTRSDPTSVSNDGDKAGRVGDYNLQFKSSTAYSTKVEQTIAPRRFALPDGTYTLSAWHMSVKDVRNARLYAVSNGQTYETSIAASTNGEWVEASVPVTVSGGEVTVGISVEGDADDMLRADDISLVRGDGSGDGGPTDPDPAPNPDPDKPGPDQTIDSKERLTNGGFENGDSSAWTLTPRNDTALGAVTVKAKDARSGGYALGSWTSGVQDYEMTQTVTGLPEGWYELSGWAQGQNDHNDDVTLGLLSGDDVLGSSKVTLAGTTDGKTYDWTQSTTLVHFEGGDLTARLSVKADAGAWASYDDFSLRQVESPAVDSIEVGTMPTKTEYRTGESLDADGLTVIAVYHDGQGNEVRLPLDESEYTLSGFDSSKAAEALDVTITLKSDESKTASFAVKITAKPETDPGTDGDGSGDSSGDGSEDGGTSEGDQTPDADDDQGNTGTTSENKPAESAKPAKRTKHLPATGVSCSGVAALAAASIIGATVAIALRRRMSSDR